MTNVNLNHLKYFHVVTRSRTMTEAAAKLKIAQPSLTSQIKLLEKSLGFDLFQKDGRFRVLTKEGAVMSELADDVFLQIDIFEARAKAYAIRTPTNENT